MDDGRIIDLYWERSENSIVETAKKYSRYCFSISFNILHNNEDAEEAQPNTMKIAKLFKKPFVSAAVIAAFALLCAFTVYVMVGDYWNQVPSQDPTETVRSAIENQIDKEYTISVEIESIEIDEAETARVIGMYSGSELAQARGWTDEYLAEHFIVVKAVYYVEYDHTKTPLDDGFTVQYFYLTRDIKSGEWAISDNTGYVG